MGSKARHAKEILPIILKDRAVGQWYVEPFVGGANVIDKVDGNRLGADIHNDLIIMWQAVAKGWFPDQQLITEDNYRLIKNEDIGCKALRGFVGFACSYGGKWFGGWCRDGAGKRNYVSEALNNAKKQFPKLYGVNFVNSDYFNLNIPDNSIIYCDPPYKGTTGYSNSFNHEKFYDWCRKQKEAGNTVFVSEYEMPSDFICVWSKEVNSSLTKETGSKKAVEKLFKL